MACFKQNQEISSKVTKKKKALWAGKATSAVCMVLLVAVLISSCCFSSNKGGSVEDAIERYINLGLYLEFDKADLKAMAPDKYWKSVDIDKVYSLLKDAAEEEKEDMIDEEGEDFFKELKVDWEMGYRTDLSAEECRDLEDCLEDRHGVNYSMIDEAYSFTLEVEMTYGDDDEIEKMDLVAVKMDGNWYLAWWNETYELADWAVDDYVEWVLED